MVLSSVSGTTADASPAITSYLKSAGTTARLAGDYFLDSAVVVPNTVRQLELAAGTRLKIRGSHNGLVRSGTIVYREMLPATIAAGATSITVTRTSAYRVGEYLLLSGSDVVPDSPDKYGYLRQVTSISGTAVGIDGAIPRTIAVGPRTSSVTLAPSLRIFGAGEVFSTDPSTGKSALIVFFATDSPTVDGIDVHDNGATAINVSHCLNGSIACTIHDLLDDGVTYFGYGVNVTGATRGLVVGGTISRVRHAVTTNPGASIVSIGPVGEPEDCIFQPLAIDCSDKSIDTHRLGWNTTIIPNVHGGHGGVQIRADNTKVRGGTIVGSAGPGIAVAAGLLFKADIRDVSITNLQPSGTALFLNSPSDATNVTIRDCYGTNIVLSDNCHITGGSISAGNSVGVNFLGSNNIVEQIQLGASVKTPFVEAAGATGNTFSTSPPDSIQPLPAPQATTAPSITGTLVVGNQLLAKFGKWDVGPVIYTYTWSRDGVILGNAVERDNPKYDLVSGDMGKRMTVTVTARRTGYADGVASSPSTDPIQPGAALTPTTAPALSGTPKVGTYLSVTAGTWSPAAQSTSVAWAVDGVVVAGQTSARYQVKSVDVGKSIAAIVTAKRTGWTNGSFTTPGKTATS